MLTVPPLWAQLPSELEPLPLAPAQPEGEQIPQLDTTTLTFDCEPITWVDYDWAPLNPMAGEVVTFTISSHLPPTATIPITYTWDFDDSHTGAGDLISHTYVISGSYSVYVTAANLCGEVYMSHPVDVTSDPDKEPDIDVSPTHGFAFMSYTDETVTDTVTISNHPSATAYLTWDLTEDPAASWLDTSAANGLLAPGDDDNVIITVDTTGLIAGASFSTTLRITSNDPDESPWISTTIDLYVFHRPVEAVTLTVATTGRIYTDTVVSFSADIEPDHATMPYTYTIDYGSGPSVPSTSAADPHLFAHTFTVTGSYTVSFSAWNSEMSGPSSDSASVTVSAHDQRLVYLPIVVRGP